MSAVAPSWLQAAPAFSAGIALLALVVSTVTLVTGRTALHQSRIALVTQIRTEWSRLDKDWVTSLVLARGPFDYYTPASRDLRETIKSWSSEIAQQDDFSVAQDRARDYASMVHAVVAFLDLCATLVLQGRLRSADVYAVLGPQVARHGAAIRWLCGARSETLWRRPEIPAGYEPWEWLSVLREDAFTARQERILALIDLLWAQLAAAGDHYPHILMTHAVHKRRQSGAICRRRARRLAHQQKGSPLRLQVELLKAEYLPTAAYYQQNAEPRDVVPTDWKCVRVGGWRIRALRSFVGAYLSAPPRYLLLRRRLSAADWRWRRQP